MRAGVYVVSRSAISVRSAMVNGATSPVSGELLALHDMHQRGIAAVEAHTQLDRGARVIFRTKQDDVARREVLFWAVGKEGREGMPVVRWQISFTTTADLPQPGSPSILTVRLRG